LGFPLGELASLGAACCWAVGLNLFRRDVREIGARPVNLFKALAASVLFLLVLIATGFERASPAAHAELALSGIVGLALGDTCLFYALGHLGAHRTALLGSLGPVFTAVGGWLLLDEPLTAWRCAGIVMAGVGVTMVVWGRPARGAADALAKGALAGVLGALCHASGVLLAKRGQAELAALPAATIRLTSATAVLVLFALARGRLRPDLERLLRPAPLLRLLPAAAIGTFLGIGLMQVGIAHTQSAVASALHSTTPLFTLPIALFVLRERVGPVALVGSVVGVAGVVLLFLG